MKELTLPPSSQDTMPDCLFCLQSVLLSVMKRNKCPWGLPFYPEGTDHRHDVLKGSSSSDRDEAEEEQQHQQEGW